MQTRKFAASEKVYVSDINPENVSQDIRSRLQFIGFSEIIDSDSTVFIKPNLTDSKHTFGVTNTPLMIKTVIEVISPLVKRVIVGESDRGNHAFSADVSLRNHGIYDVAQHFSNVEVLNLSKLSRTMVD
jgi:uncharacterized protein (DUF362 family)